MNKTWCCFSGGSEVIVKVGSHCCFLASLGRKYEWRIQRFPVSGFEITDKKSFSSLFQPVRINEALKEFWRCWWLNDEWGFPSIVLFLRLFCLVGIIRALQIETNWSTLVSNTKHWCITLHLFCSDLEWHNQWLNAETSFLLISPKKKQGYKQERKVSLVCLLPSRSEPPSSTSCGDSQFRTQAAVKTLKVNY